MSIATNNISKNTIKVGGAFTVIVALILLGSAIAKIAGAPGMVNGLVRAGLPREAIVPSALLNWPAWPCT